MTSSQNLERLSRLRDDKIRLLAQRETLLANLSALDKEIADVSTEYGRLHNEGLPISQIPDEVLHIILQLVKSNQRPSKPIHRRAEILFSAVCSRWRRATLSFGDLWNTFRTSRPSHNARNRLVACLERSGTYPLDLWFDFRPVGLHDLPDGYHLLRDAIKHVHRWRRFTILTEIETPLKYLLYHLKDSEAPNLEAFTALPNRAWEYDLETATLSSSEAIMLTKGTPQLRYLCLNDLSSMICLPSMTGLSDLRLDMMEGIESAWIDWSTFLGILKLPSLTSLSLVGQAFMLSEERYHTIPRIEMPSLKYLRHASLLATGFVDAVLPNITAPNLTSLTLKDLPLPSDQRYWSSPDTPIIPFPNLCTLTLIEFEFYQHPFVSKLSELTSNISTLVVADGCGAWDRRMDRQDPFTTGWRDIETLALNTRSQVLNLYHLKTFVQLRPALKKLIMPEWSVGDANDGLVKPPRFADKGVQLEVVKWRTMGEVDVSLGAWPPGSKDSDGVDDPFAFDLFLP